MPTRLTNTEKWKGFFFKKLPLEYKLFWQYINDDCDFCGLWTVDIEVAELRVGAELSVDIALELFGSNVQVLQDGQVWFIPEFIATNYGTLSQTNSVHRKVAAILASKCVNVCDRNNIENTQKTPQKRGDAAPKDMDMEMDMEKEKDMDIKPRSQKKSKPETIQGEIDIWPTFEEWWNLYDKKIDKIKAEKAWQKLTQLERETAMFHGEQYVKATPNKSYRKDPTTYLNNKSFNNEIPYPETRPENRNTGGNQFDEQVSREIQDRFNEAAKRRGSTP